MILRSFALRRVPLEILAVGGDVSGRRRRRASARAWCGSRDRAWPGPAARCARPRRAARTRASRGRAGPHDEREARGVRDPPRSSASSTPSISGATGAGAVHDVPRAMPGEILLGAAHELDHALVRFAGASRRRRRCRDSSAPCRSSPASRLERTRARTTCARSKPGITYGMTTTAFAVDLADARFAARGVGDREHRVGVGVIDELVRHAAVQDRLDRRRRCRRAQSCA